MNFPTWLPFFKKHEDNEPKPAEEAADQPRVQPGLPNVKAKTGVGPVTGRRLDDLECLRRPFVTDPFYRLRPPFSHKAAELSLELAQMAYTMEIEPWRQAGWNDFSIQIDNTLQSGLTHGENASGERMQSIMNAWKLYRAKAALSELNPVSQIIAALRQRQRSDTIKAVCMMHPCGDGQYMLAIGFMGTGKRLYDWISNFRFTTEEGFHKGFFQLCTYFEQGAENIIFPATAQALGLEKLTLGEVLSEMRSGDSRFHLWMAGHSQGGAVMQVFTHRLLTQWGVTPQNIVGYGFASPTVATDKFVYDPASYPLYHIINSDDSVPRMGALVHLGLCMNYPANEDFRQSTYHLSQLPADVAVYQRLAPFNEAMTDVESILRYGAAFVETLGEEKGEENLNLLMGKKWSLPFIDKALVYAGDKTMDLLEAALRQLNAGYEDLMGRPMDRRNVQALCDQMRPIVRELPLRRLLGGIASYTLPPHHLCCGEGEGAYSYIVNRDLEALEPFIWVKQENGLPVKRFAEADPEILRGEAAFIPSAKHRRRPTGSKNRFLGVQRRSYSASRQLGR